jgi:pimeloyl-ACP methyl ester carboxylesterase
MPFARVRGIDVHYVEHGAARDAAERTAVLLHGFTLDQRSAVATFEPSFRGRRGWRRLYLDFPGMGHTHAPDWVASTDDVFAVARAAVDELVDGRYAAGGISFGGYVAAGLAATAPERVTGLALVVPMVADRPDRELADFAVLRRDPGVVAAADLDEMAVVQTAEVVRRVHEELDPAEQLADESAIERIDSRYGGSFPLSPPGGFRGPALVLVGRQDNVVGYADQWRVYSRWPRATFVVLDRAGHLLPIEQEALTEALVGDWLDRIEQPTPG